MDISCSQLYLLEEKYRNFPEMKDNQRSGRPPKIDKYMERRIVRAIKKNPFKSSVVLTQEVNQGIDEEKKVSNSAFKQTAIGKGIRAYKPVVKPKLDPKHIRTRLNFARNFGNMCDRFWQNVLYADEVSLQLHPTDKRRRVRRSRGERYKAPYTEPSYSYHGGSIMFWGIIGWHGQGPLVLIEDTLDMTSYRDLLRQEIPGVLANQNLRHPYLLEDHSTSHDGRLARDAKIEVNLRTFENYPSRSPDLNPIEHVWRYWKDRIRARYPQSLEQLEDYAYEEWENIPLNFIRNCIRSMPDRLAEVNRMKGLHTKY